MQDSRPAASDEMPFLDHLEELRWRIIWSLAAVIVSVGVAFWVMLQFDVIGLLEKPILPYLNGRHLVYTHPGDPFSIVLNAAIALGAASFTSSGYSFRRRCIGTKRSWWSRCFSLRRFCF